MESKTKHKNAEAEKILEQDLFDAYLKEMDDLVNKYPEDPNNADITEQKLNQLISDLDNNWMSFKKKWQKQLGPLDESAKIVATGKMKKSKKGIGHLIIKSELTKKNLLDLVVPADKNIE